MKNAKRKNKTDPARDVTEEEDFYRLLNRAIFLPSTSRKSARTKPATLDNAT